MQQQKKHPLPDWLRTVQQQSWEPEILISGIVLFALFQVPDLLDRLYLYLDSVSVLAQGTIVRNIIALLKVSNFWLTLGFGAHLFFRSIWAAYVGLSYVYPDGIDHDRLRYRPAFLRLIARQSDYPTRIQQLERLCSGFFATSFFLFMCIVGALSFFLLISIMALLIFAFYPEFVNSPWFERGLNIFAFTFGGLYLFDFLTLGLLKRIPYVSTVYYPVYRLMSAITLAPFYRNIYYGFISNHHKGKVAALVLLFLLSTFVITIEVQSSHSIFNNLTLQTYDDTDSIFPGHYADQQSKQPSHRIQIPSDIITGDVLRVFVVHSRGRERRQVLRCCNYDSLKAAHPKADTDSLKLACLDQFYRLDLDGKEVDKNVLFYTDPKTKQNGFLSYLDISTLEPGLHYLDLYYNYVFDDGSRKASQKAQVEFYRQ